MPLQPRQWIAPTTITLETCANFFRMRHYDREIPILEQRTWVGFDLLVGMFARQRKLATPLTLGAVASTSTAVASSSLAVVEIVDFSLVFTIGDSSRRRPGEFINPLGVAVDRDRDRIIAVDSFNHRLQLFAALDGARSLFEFGHEGNEPGQFNCPRIDNQGRRIIVTDTYNHRLQAFSPEGHHVSSLECGVDGPRPLEVASDKHRGLIAFTEGLQAHVIEANQWLPGTFMWRMDRHHSDPESMKQAVERAWQ